MKLKVFRFHDDTYEGWQFQFYDGEKKRGTGINSWNSTTISNDGVIRNIKDYGRTLSESDSIKNNTYDSPVGADKTFAIWFQDKYELRYKYSPATKKIRVWTRLL